MTDINKECEMASFKDKEVGFNVANVKKEVDVSMTETRQELNTNVVEINGKMDMSLVKIKTEPNCDIAPGTVHLMHQELNSFDTMLTAVKEEIDSDTDSNNKNVTIHLLIPETILIEKTEVDIQANSEENLLPKNSSVDSDMPSAQSELTETREDSNVSSNTIPVHTSVQSVPIGSTKRQRRKRKNDSESCDLESPAPQSSTTRFSEIEPVKKRRRMRKGLVSDKRNVDEVSDHIDLEGPSPHSSTELSEIILVSPQSERRGRKKGSANKHKKEKTTEMVVCPFCDRKMVKHYFPYHARVHTDEKPFKCSLCPYTSHFKGPLNSHIESHHPTQGYLIPK